MSFRGRVAVVGARRRRQGTGEFIARELAGLGCEVVAVVGTSAATVDEARAALRERHGLDCRGYTRLAELLEREDVDAVAICSPPEAHLEQLEQAAAAGCHVLCEKPLFWSDALLGPDGAALARARAEAVADALAAAGRTLAVGAQWPFTLEAFRALHPGTYGPGRPVERFAMWLAPASRGRTMVVDSASHPLSMLQALVGRGEIEAIRVVEQDPEGLVLRWVHRAASGPVEAELTLRRSETIPRPAGYAINGARACRRVNLPDYAISFVAEGATNQASVPVRDPLAASVAAFVQRAAGGEPPDRAAVSDGMAHLQALVAATARGEDA